MINPTSKERDLPKLLRDAERRVNAHVFKTGGDDSLASIPANLDRDVDLLLMEAALEIELLQDREARLRGQLDAAEQHVKILQDQRSPVETTSDDHQSGTIKSLCDRLDFINNICHDAVMQDDEKVRQIEEWSAGFMPVPGSTENGKGSL